MEVSADMEPASVMAAELAAVSGLHQVQVSISSIFSFILKDTEVSGADTDGESEVMELVSVMDEESEATEAWADDTMVRSRLKSSKSVNNNTTFESS